MIFHTYVFEHKMGVLISLQILSEIFLILRRTERDVIVNVRRYSGKVLVILSDFNESRTFYTDFSKTTQI